MCVGTALGSIDQFVNALTESAFQNARASFEVYRRNGLLDSDGALQRAGEFAAWLGWGRWFVAYLATRFVAASASRRRSCSQARRSIRVDRLLVDPSSVPPFRATDGMPLWISVDRRDGASHKIKKLISRDNKII